MFGRSIDLFTIFGFAIRLDLSWFLIAILVAWSLATGLFPVWYEDLSVATYWSMGIAGSLGLFASVVLHELAHSLEARRHGLEMKGITLFIFGGVAEMADEPPSPKAEFLVAIAGPICSVALGLAFLAARFLGEASQWPTPLVGVLAYLGFINLVLVAFNIVPAFPLDGGRVLRSALWKWRNDLRWATRTTSIIGSGFGFVLIALGVLSVLSGNFIGGMWWFLIGLFLRNAAQMSYQQLLVRRMLEGEPVRRFMNSDPVTVPRSISIKDLVEDYVYRYHHHMFPVVDDGRLVGCVTTSDIKAVPQEEWERQSVGSIAEACGADNSISPDEDAVKALSRMSGGKRRQRLLVTEGDRLVGILTLPDLAKLFSLRVELEDS